jgi:hypothetical protein
MYQIIIRRIKKGKSPREFANKSQVFTKGIL